MKTPNFVVLIIFIFLTPFFKWARRKVMREVISLLINRKEKEIFLLYLSELKHSEVVQAAGELVLLELEGVDIFLKMWRDILPRKYKYLYRDLEKKYTELFKT